MRYLWLRKARPGFFLLCVVMFPFRVYGQNLNPSFPRTMFLRNPNGGAIDYFFSRFDLAMVGGGDENSWAIVDSIRQLNPECMVMGGSRQGVWPGSDPPEAFVYTHLLVNLTSTAEPGDQEVFVTNTQGFPASGDNDRYVLIGYDDWITYEDTSDSSFVGVPTSGTYALDYTHPIGDSVKTPIRISGMGMMQNLTPLAPTIEGTPVYEYFVDMRFETQDFSKYDGTYWDAFHFTWWSDAFPRGIDLDVNHVNDLDEHGIDWVNEQWELGATQMLAYEHQKFSEANPGAQPLVLVNNGNVKLGYALDACEGMMWEGFMKFATSWEDVLEKNLAWKDAHQPVYTMILSYDPELRIDYGKNVFRRIRYGLTTAMMADCYFAHTFGTYFYIVHYYDEYDTDVGYPTSEPQMMPSGAYARFFDSGVAICNPTGGIITVTDAELSGLTGYQGPYYRFLGGQDPEKNNGVVFESLELWGSPGGGTGAKYIEGDGIILLTHPDTVVSDIIVGNMFNNDTSPGSEAVVLEGSWQNVRDPSNDFPDRNPCYSQWNGSTEGIGYAYASAGDGSSTARFVPTIGVPGYYEIYEWHGWVGDAPGSYQEADNVPYEIVIAGEVRRRGMINQRTRAGRWNRLGLFFFPTGDTSFVEISNNADGFVIADAFRFAYRGSDKSDNEPPAAPQGVRIEQP